MTEGALEGRTEGGVAQAPDRNLALDLVRVTEAAGMAAARWAEAKALLTKLAEADSTPGPASRERRIPTRLRVLGTLGIVTARLKQPAEALRIDSLLKAAGTVSEGGEIEVMRARIHAQLGDLEEAVALAEAGRGKGWELLSLMNSLADDHWLVPLRTLPSFRSIMALND